MKKLLTAVLSFLFLALALPTFAQENTATAQTVSDAVKMLNGSWEWTESRFASRGVPPTIKTPASTQQHLVVTFKPDNQALVFINKELVGTLTYTVTKPMNEYLMIQFTSGPDGQTASPLLEQGPLIVSATEMNIAGGYNDAGSNQTFKKITAAKTTKKSTKTRKKRSRK